MQTERIYFDYNATAPMLPEVKQAITEISNLPLNPSASHSYGKLAKKLLENARKEVADAVAVSTQYNVVFTASGTEANNLALQGIKGVQVITSVIEHPSILRVVGEGLLHVDCNGILKLDTLEMILKAATKPTLVSIMMANNETGVIQPMKEIASLVHKYHAILHTDASQALGKIPCNLEEIGVDMMTVSAHKFGGPIGAGALIFKKGLPLTPIMLGGGQEFRMRPGTQNILAIHGFGVACSKIEDIMSSFAKTAQHRNFLEAQLLEISPSTIILSKNAPRLPNVSSFTMPSVSSETQLIYFDINGFAVSIGSACSSGRVDLPYVHMALGLDLEEANCAIRVSMGPENTKHQVKKFIECWKELYQKSERNYD